MDTTQTKLSDDASPATAPDGGKGLGGESGSATPRTDAVAWSPLVDHRKETFQKWKKPDGNSVDADFSRQLETELNTANARIRELEEERDTQGRYAVEMFDALKGRVQGKYHELIMAVARKFVGETRHETALRYIKEAELTRRRCEGAGSLLRNEEEEEYFDCPRCDGKGLVGMMTSEGGEGQDCEDRHGSGTLSDENPRNSRGEQIYES